MGLTVPSNRDVLVDDEGILDISGHYSQFDIFNKPLDKKP